MIDPALNRRLESCRQIMKAWHKFHTFLTACMSGQEFDGKAEGLFLRLKSQIAILHDSFLEAIDTNDRDRASVSQSIITLVERCILLREVKRMSIAELKKMEMEWHEAYLLVNDTIGILEEEQSRLNEISHLHHTLEVGTKKVTVAVNKVLRSNGFKFTVVAAAVITAAIILPAMGVFSYHSLDRGFGKKPYRIALHLIRSSVSKKLPYRDMEDYRQRGRGNFLEIDFEFGEPKGKKGDLVDFFARKSARTAREYTGVEELDLREHAKQAKETEETTLLRKLTMPNKKDAHTMGAAFLCFPDNRKARDFESKIQTWKSTKLPETGPAADLERRIHFGRRNNVVWFLMTLVKDNPDTQRADDILRQGLNKKMKIGGTWDDK